MSFFSGILQGLFGIGGGSLSGLSDTASALIAFFTTVTDYRMWRSLAWLLLGVAMLAGGAFLWAKSSAASFVRKAL